MIDAIVLAAGQSRRMGKSKPLLRFGDTTFLEQIVSVLHRSQIERVTVVLGANAEMIANSVDLSEVDVVVNANYERGQLSSLIAGLRRTPIDTEAILLCLVDNPFITPEIVDQIVEVFKQTQSPIVLPTFNGRRGHPVLFSRRMFDDLLSAPPEAGARHVVHLHEGQVIEVEMPDDAILTKIDTADEYRSRFGAAP
jgi:molybdenum cofactor cytidylyltransferase